MFAFFPPARRWSSPPASSPLSGAISPSSSFRLGACYHHPTDLPDTTGLSWREGIFRFLGSVRARVRTSLCLKVCGPAVKSVYPRARKWVSNSTDLRAKVLDPYICMCIYIYITSVRSALKSKPCLPSPLPLPTTPEPAPFQELTESTPFQELTASTPEPAPFHELTESTPEPAQFQKLSESTPESAPFQELTESTQEPAPVQELIESTPEPAPLQELTESAPPECPLASVPLEIPQASAATERPLASAPPERPQESVLPERP